MSLSKELEKAVLVVNLADECGGILEFSDAADNALYFLRDHGQALLGAVDENEKLWDLVCWNIDNFRDLPLTDGYYAKWLERAETLLAARSKTVDGGGA